jgi:hypothetical protein
MDSTNENVLSAASSQAVTIGSVINEIYNLFLCDDDVVRTDTDVDGATLLSGSVTELRWIGFVLTDSSGDLYDFTLSDNRISYKDNITLGSSINGTVTISFSGWIPATRASHITLMCTSNDEGYYVNLYYPDGASDEMIGGTGSNYVNIPFKMETSEGGVKITANIGKPLFMKATYLRR